MEPSKPSFDFLIPSSGSSSDELDDQIDQTLLTWMSLAKQQLARDKGGSSRPRRRAYIERYREKGHQRLYDDYFSEDPPPVYPDTIFRRRFRMRRPLFLRIVNQLSNDVEYFKQKRDATGRMSLSALQKCTAAIRMLAYGVGADAVDEYLRLGESTSRKCLTNFVEGVISAFGETYLGRPTEADMQRLLHVGEVRGFQGMIGSIDCMHWEWKNCPTAWAGQFSGKEGKPTIMLEAVASYDLWIWHAFFGTPGTCNDINVLDRSPVFNDVLQGLSPPVRFVVNGHEYNMSYYLTDGIYPPWATFIPSITLPQGDKAKLFARLQEATRKDVERAFGVLQARFAIIKNPALAWDITFVGKIMRACIILHNMIVEDERDTYSLNFDFSHFDHAEDNDPSYSIARPTPMEKYLENRMQLRNRSTHYRLKEDLVEHIWQKFRHAYV